MINRWDKFRVVTIALIFSIALNIGLLLTLGFSAYEKSRDSIPTAKLILPSPEVSHELISEMLKLSFPELLVYLTDKTTLTQGYLKRDLALAALAFAHDFNLEKALSSQLPQNALIEIADGKRIAIYPGLNDEQFEAIIRFGYQEKWPLTAKGLFHALKAWPKETRDSSLSDAFFATAEFYAVQVLFQKTGMPLEPNQLLDLLIDGPWDAVASYYESQSRVLDLTVEKRRYFLQYYLSIGSKTAAKCILQGDYAYGLTQLTDDALLKILEFDGRERLCQDLLRSQRSVEIKDAANQRLSSFTKREKQVVKPTSIEHIVQEGESLWKISRQYKVKVEDLIQHNGLEKDRLMPGMVLVIPQGTGSEPPR